jgi:hypothetical protein
MSRLEQYANWLVQNKDKQGTPEFETVASAYRTIRQSAAEPIAPIYTPPKKLGGLKDMFFESAKTLGLADEAAAFYANPNEENRKALLAAGESKFRTVGFGEGENWAAFKQLLGGSLG